MSTVMKTLPKRRPASIQRSSLAALPEPKRPISNNTKAAGAIGKSSDRLIPDHFENGWTIPDEQDKAQPHAAQPIASLENRPRPIAQICPGRGAKKFKGLRLGVAPFLFFNVTKT